MTNRKYFGLCLCIAAIGLGGCANIGSTPSGGSDAQVKAAFDNLPLDQQVKSIMSSPAPQAHKEEMIRKAYAKAGKEVPADLFGSAPKGAH